MRVVSIFVAVAFTTMCGAAAAQPIEWKNVDVAMGRKAKVSGDVHRYGFPRTDLHVRVDGVAIKPALALGGWVAMKPAPDGVMLMGDLVLLESEINPVMTKAIADGLQITAVHNHILRANPATFYMHVAGHGDPLRLAAALHGALEASKTPAPSGASAAPKMELNTAQLDRILGVKGKEAGGVYQVSVPRREQIAQNGMTLDPPGPLGVATGLNFQPIGEGGAAISGDLVLTANEVNPVIQALQASGIEITALHSHMLDEQPRLFFMHFWAQDDALKLAKGLRGALDKMRTTETVGSPPSSSGH